MENRINSAAIRIALRFTQVEDLPERLSGQKKELFSEIKKDSAAERRFQLEISKWKNFINKLISIKSNDMIWRFLSTSPIVEPGTESVSLCHDFIKANDLLIHIRNDKKPSPEMIGKYSQLLTAFQKEIETKILGKR